MIPPIVLAVTLLSSTIVFGAVTVSSSIPGVLGSKNAQAASSDYEDASTNAKIALINDDVKTALTQIKNGKKAVADAINAQLGSSYSNSSSYSALAAGVTSACTAKYNAGKEAGKNESAVNRNDLYAGDLSIIQIGRWYKGPNDSGFYKASTELGRSLCEQAVASRPTTYDSSYDWKGVYVYGFTVDGRLIAPTDICRIVPSITYNYPDTNQMNYSYPHLFINAWSNETYYLYTGDYLLNYGDRIDLTKDTYIGHIYGKMRGWLDVYYKGGYLYVYIWSTYSGNEEFGLSVTNQEPCILVKRT